METPAATVRALPKLWPLPSWVIPFFALGEETGDFVAFLGEITPLGEAGSLRKVLLRLGISRRIPG